MEKGSLEYVERWRIRPLTNAYPYVYLNKTPLKRNGGGEIEKTSVLTAMGVNADGFREIIGVYEGAKEDIASWRAFLRHLKHRGLSGVKLFMADEYPGLAEVLSQTYPDAKYQRCVTHFYLSMFRLTPYARMKTVAEILRKIYASEDEDEAMSKSIQAVAKLRLMHLEEAADRLETGIEGTLAYMSFSEEHRDRLRTDNKLERVMMEIQARIRGMDESFPEDLSIFQFVCTDLRRISSNLWGKKRFLHIDSQEAAPLSTVS